MLRRSHLRTFFFTWQSPDLQKWSSKHNYQSPVWVDQSDLRWVSNSICALKPSGSAGSADNAEVKGHTTNELPVRLTLFNLNQLDTSAKYVSAPLTAYDCPPEKSSHTSFSTKREYSSTMQFQLEQRAVIAGLMPSEEEIEAAKMTNAAASGSEGTAVGGGERLPTEYFWITPKEAYQRRFKPKKTLAEEFREPFSILTKARKTVFNADQFVEPKAFERYPISVASGRPMLSHQHAELTSWHEAHFATLDENDVQKNELFNRLCIFGSRKEYAEMGLKLKADAAVVVCKVYSSTSNHFNGKNSNDDEENADVPTPAPSSTTDEVEEAWGSALKNPRDTDVVHYSLIANQDALWERSRIVRPTSSSSSSSTSERAQKHVIIPQGMDCFKNMIPRLDEYLEKHNPEMKRETFWVTRHKVREMGLQLIEGAEWVQVPLYKKSSDNFAARNKAKQDKEIEEKANATMELFHISQCENPSDALTRVGKHTK